MKFATIAASVLVASSVLATAGVVSADVKTAEGTAEVSVTGEGGVLQIDKAPGVQQKGDVTGANLKFQDVTLNEFLTKDSVETTAPMSEGAFGVTNTTGTPNWALTAKVGTFTGTNNEGTFEGLGMSMNPTGVEGNDLPLNGTAALYTSADKDGWNTSHTVWQNAGTATAKMSVPSTVKLGKYTADITYTLTTGTSTNTPSGN